ncbi:dynamin family protein [Tepidibacillus marianensis]|uniref:dynamin family protein n=1 Tax=Tepidibacillus marianensis TaxID=3131995 RepID=UPI0030D2899B
MITIKEQTQRKDTIPFSVEEQLRLKKLADKKQNSRFELAFCGHFSAGKSTILNTLLGAELLPTSPIPTSANIIELINGELGLTIHTRDNKKKVWNEQIPWGQAREWGMNGNEIVKIVISAPFPFLGHHSQILDTPGVDSTDDSHQAVTVEQLFTTDVIVYVMDYNYVQSETNLYFLKQLSTEKKPIYIVINQVDKHNEDEIPFSIFQQSVEEIFHRWEIRYLGIYFTSMKNTAHPLNQFAQFEQKIKSLLYNSSQFLKESELRLEQGFFQSVKNRLLLEKQDMIDDVMTEMKEKGYDLGQLEEQRQLQFQLKRTRNYDQHLWEEFEDELGKVFKNVTLFPFTTTDLARNWIESLQPDFKVGLFFSKKKTVEEQELRLNRLVQELQDKVKSQLLFHVQAYFQKVDRTRLNNLVDFENVFSELTYLVRSEWLKEHVKTDYASRDYVFAFTSEITSLIVKEIRDQAKTILDLQIQGMEGYIQAEEQRLVEKLFTLKEIEDYVEQIEEIETTFSRQVQRVEQILTQYPPETVFNQRLLKATQLSYPEDHGCQLIDVTIPKDSVIGTNQVMDAGTTAVHFSEEDTARWLENIKKVLIRNHEKKILSQERKDLLERIERYRNQTFIVSLFGAFSSGKSSFANALLGDHVLPVSPNPTTATINTVEKSTLDHPHGTAKITIKTREALNEEVRIVSSQLDLTLRIEELKDWKPDMKNYLSSWQKTHLEYLLMLKQSLATTEWEFGSSFSVNLSEAQILITEESKACLISQVNIYYDSPITEKGIILVDTPGVNSIHGRHTNVAFQQLRNSDAIFYLTYYNHAFSKADQYFLHQIGKVNESFQHDKLYFVINAADLAGSVRELNGVRKHILDQLVRNGVEHPRLYQLSSKDGLQAKKEKWENETSFSQFERSFYDHTILELKQLSVRLITNQLKLYVGKMNDSISFMKQEAEEQIRIKELLNETVSIQSSQVEKASFNYVIRDVTQELEQLLLYLQDRMKLVLRDYYSTAINVTVLTGSNKKELHEQLHRAIKEWKTFGEYFLKQELEATIIRVEEKMKDHARKWLHFQRIEAQKELPYFFVDEEVATKTNVDQLYDIYIPLDMNRYFPYLKSKKDFFENGKVKELKESLVTDGVEAIQVIIKDNLQYLTKIFEEKMFQLEEELKYRFIEAISNELLRFEVLLEKEEQLSLEREYEQFYRLI